VAGTGVTTFTVFHFHLGNPSRFARFTFFTRTFLRL
jgi:hypothetical protein